MLIWLITSGEILPGNYDRPHRTGMLSEALAEKGHDVLWWTTTFDHQTKKYIHNKSFKEKLRKGIEIYFLHADFSYKKNISIKRLINHKYVSKSFELHSSIEKIPDLIYCSFPTIELSYEAVKYGKKNNVPVILDVRDLWPDIFLDPFPKWLQPALKLALCNYYNKTQYAFENCIAITAVSESYLKWGLSKAKREQNENDEVFPLGYQLDAISKIDKNLKNSFLKSKGIDTTKTIVWFVGTFGQTYDLSTIIKAAKLLESNGRNEFQFVFTGDGQNMDEWQKQAGGIKNIIFTGWVNKEQLAYIADTAKIGLMAYRENAPQSLPNKIFEYMAAGIPILSSLQGDTKELLEKHQIGLTYKANNTESFIIQLNKLMQNNLLLELMSSNGKKIFTEYFSSEIIYKKLVNYIENQTR